MGKVGEPLKHDPNFNGPIKKRGCTDILCLIIFIIFIIGWIVVAILAFKYGNPENLIKPTDSSNNRCGEGDLWKKEVLYFFDLTKCVTKVHNAVVLGCPTTQVCLEKCPEESYFPKIESVADLHKPYGSLDNATRNKLICKYDVDATKTLQQLMDNKDCAEYILASTSLVGRCIPTISGLDKVTEQLKNVNISQEEIKSGGKFLSQFLNLRNVGELLFEDFKVSWKIIVGALALAMVVSLLWIVLMRWLAFFMVWISIFLVLGLLGFGSYFSVDRYIALSKNQTVSDIPLDNEIIQSYLAQKKTWLVIGIILIVILAVLSLILLFLRSRITLAVALIGESSKAVGNIMSTLFFPIIPFLLQILVIGFWIAVSLYISSASIPKGVAAIPPGCSCKSLSTFDECSWENFTTRYECTGSCNEVKCISTTGHDNIQTVGQLFNLFSMFWLLFFVIGFGQMVLAGTFATWYWTYEKSKVPFFVVSSSLHRTFRYHLGSLAFGSLLIATVKMIRVFLEYVDRKLKEYTDNPVAKCIMCCMKCCFWCLEKFIKFINRNAYIMVAVYGKNFCTSARHAFSLLLRNIVRVVVLDKVTDFLLFLGKMTVVMGIGVLSFYFFSGKLDIPESIVTKPTLNYNLMPVIVIGVGSYVITSCFFSVYSMAVDTLFLCFLEDCERNDGSAEKPYMMSKNLMKILGKKNKLHDPANDK